MRPLREIAQNSARPYAFVRCGGLYQAFLEWTGYERMSEQVWAKMDGARINCLTAAILISVNEGIGDVDVATNVVKRDARNIADLYLARFEANYARDGQAFFEDQLVRSDMAFCESVAVFSQNMGAVSGEK
jgi:hypothetical protein